MAEQQYYLVRHGQTELNSKGLLQGRSDSKLTEKGISQAQAMGDELAGILFDRIYSSDTKRAKATADIIMKKQRKLGELIYRPGLREYYFGGLEKTSSAALMFRTINKFGVKAARKLVSEPDRFIGLVNTFDRMDETHQAESFTDLNERAKQQFQQLITENQEVDGGRYLIVSHGLFLSALIHHLDNQAVPKNLLKNGSVSIIDVVNGKPKLNGVNLTELPFDRING